MPSRHTYSPFVIRDQTALSTMPYLLLTALQERLVALFQLSIPLFHFFQRTPLFAQNLLELTNSILQVH